MNLNEMYVGTFHSICLRVIKEHLEYTRVKKNYRMLDQFDQKYMIFQHINDFRALPHYEDIFTKKIGTWKQAGEIAKYVSNLLEELVDVNGMLRDSNPATVGNFGFVRDINEDLFMANNLVDRDAYIIIGVNEECDYAIQDVSQDANRRNTQMLTDFIRGKKFAGDFRPVVTVEQVHLDGGLVDVIVVHNSINTPYYLKEKYKGIFANNIYVRLQDSNTPVDKSADFHHAEYLWKKRFGMLLSPIEKVKLYLKHPEHWANSPSSEDKKYYKYAPEFTIDHTYEPEDDRTGYEYYLFAQTDSRPHWSEIRICYHQTVLAELGGVILDGGRYFTATPDRDGISLTEYHNWDVPYRYMVKGRLNHLVHEFYYVDDGDEARHSHNEYEGCILIFEDEKEHQRFRIYVRENWYRKDAFANDIWIPHMEQLPGYNMDAFREEYLNMQILRKMLEEFRKNDNTKN